MRHVGVEPGEYFVCLSLFANLDDARVIAVARQLPGLPPTVALRIRANEFECAKASLVNRVADGPRVDAQEPAQFHGVPRHTDLAAVLLGILRHGATETAEVVYSHCQASFSCQRDRRQSATASGATLPM